MNLIPEHPSDPDPGFEELVQRVLDHEASLDDLAQLNAILPRDPSALRYFVKMRRLHAALEEAHGTTSNELDSIEGRVGSRSGERSFTSFGDAGGSSPLSVLDPVDFTPAAAGPSRRGFAWIAAAFILLGALAVFWGGRRFLERADAFEVIAHSGGEAPSLPALGTWLKEGERLQLDGGAVEIRSSDGNSFTLEGPGDLLIEDRQALSLKSGKLWTVVNSGSVRIRTPQGEITDLGTTFGVDRSSPDVTRLDVLDGRVRFADGNDASRHVEAVAGRRLVRKDTGWPPVVGEADPARYTTGLRSPLGLVFVADEGEASRITSALPFGARWTPVSTPEGRVRPKGASFEISWQGDSLTSSGGKASAEAALFHTHLQSKSADFAVWNLVAADDHLDRRVGWTWETRFRIDSAHDPDRGVWEVFLRDHDHGLAATRLHFLATGIDRDTAGAGVNAEIRADLTDGFHVVRAAVEGGTNLTTVWLDGRKVIDAKASQTFPAETFGLIGRWGSQTAGGTTTIDYLRFDTTGAYAPPSDEGQGPKRHSSEFAGMIDQIEGDVDPLSLRSFGSHPVFDSPGTVVKGDGMLEVTLPTGRGDTEAEPPAITVRLRDMTAWLQAIGAKGYRISVLRSSGMNDAEFLPVSASVASPGGDQAGTYLTMLEVWEEDKLTANFPDGGDGSGTRARVRFKDPFTQDQLILTVPAPTRTGECNNLSALMVTPVF